MRRQGNSRLIIFGEVTNMKIISLLISLYLCSCVAFVDDATSKTGNHERIAFASLGGTSTLTGANGAHFTHDHQQSFRDASTAIGTAISVTQAGKTTRATTQSNNALSATKDTNSTNATINGQNNAAAASKGTNNVNEFNTAVGAGATPAVGTVNPQ